MISRFINALKARIDAYQKRKHREGKRDKSHNPALRTGPGVRGYSGAKTLSPPAAGQPGYTVSCRRLPRSGSLAGMIEQAGAVPRGGCWMLCHAGAFSGQAGGVAGTMMMLVYGICWKRADYLAKEYTKVNGTGERNFGCSRS